MQKVLVVDAKKCIGCRMCQAICSLVKSGTGSIANARINVLRYDMEGFFYPLVCLQCDVPYCVLACPSGALWKNSETGVVEQDSGKCVGCKMCMIACPFGAISFADGVAIKCDLCEGDPACVKFCEPGALTYGEIESINYAKQEQVGQTMLESYGVEPAK
jgi:carbon-monoxide dehydrogenase iron sulfur subunit